MLRGGGGGGGGDGEGLTAAAGQEERTHLEPLHDLSSVVARFLQNNDIPDREVP